MVERPTSKSSINHPSIDGYRVKVQSVRTIEVDAAENGTSIGSFVDQLLGDCYVDGWYPNKLTIEVNKFDNHPEKID